MLQAQPLSLQHSLPILCCTLKGCARILATSREAGGFLEISWWLPRHCLLPQPFWFIVAFSRSSMASSGAADAALAAAVLERERARMSLEDLRSWVAQRHFVGSLQVPQIGQTMTWEMV